MKTKYAKYIDETGMPYTACELFNLGVITEEQRIKLTHRRGDQIIAGYSVFVWTWLKPKLP